MSKGSQAKCGPAQIVRLDKAFKLPIKEITCSTSLISSNTGCDGVSGGAILFLRLSNGLMTKVVAEEPKEVEPAARPSRRGLGAKNVRQSTDGPLNDPVDRKLHAKLLASKRKDVKIPESGPKGDGNNYFSDCELESRTTIFAKNRIGPAAPSTQMKKKRK